MGGHNGALKTYQCVGCKIYWKGIKARVRAYIGDCSRCQQAKYLTLSPVGLLQPLPISEAVWTDIPMDFVDGLPKSEEFEIILVVIDR